MRAAIAETPENSHYTSIQRRVRTTQGAAESLGDTESAELDPTQPPELYSFLGGVREGTPEGLPFYLADYLEPVNWTGRAVRDDKRGALAFRRLSKHGGPIFWTPRSASRRTLEFAGATG